MARCPDCNKFVSYDDGTEPDVNLEIDPDGAIGGDAHIELGCFACGTALREASFDFEEDVSDKLEAHAKEAGVKANQCNPEIETDQELVSRTEGKGRGLKTFWGVLINYTVTCRCPVCEKNAGGAFEIEGELRDDCQASSMDECC